jgi:cytochrome P450
VSLQVIKEALRLFPPIPYLFRKVEQETDLGNGFVLPAGCYSMVVTYTTHRNPEYFPDPERFDPDRFSPENCLGRHPYAYIPFGAGRRMCVAYKFGVMEAKTMLSTILRRFHVVEAVGGISALVNNLESGVVLKPAKGFNIRIQDRFADEGKI